MFTTNMVVWWSLKPETLVKVLVDCTCVLQVFATILAMVTEEVNSFLMAARSGRAPLAMSGHILLLNWNAQV
jgi:hypothetical protein